MMSDDLKDTFDGYLMFDFSNFHGLMAQSFDNESIDVPRVEKMPKRKAPNVPGPYLESPLMDLEKSGDASEGILYNGIEEDVIPEINLEDDCLSNFNYSSSGFNLLANLDFEPDDDAYENAVNAIDPSTQNMRSNKVHRTKKTSIFSPTLQFEENGDQKIKMINIQNLEQLKDDKQLDDFYKFLRQLDFLNFSNFKQSDDHIKEEQLRNLVTIRNLFESMFEKFQKKCEQAHSVSFTSKFHYFRLQMEHFTNLVSFIVDNGTARQKLDQQSVMNKDHTLTMSVAFFKGLELIQAFRMLLLQKSMVERHLLIWNKKQMMMSKFLLFAILKNKKSKCEFVQKKEPYKPQLSQLSNSQAIPPQNSQDLENIDLPRQLRLYKENQQSWQIKGIDGYFDLLGQNTESNIARRHMRVFSKMNKSHGKYLSFTTGYIEF